jgi:ABC-type phosphate/phosphonate transport system substrate-binding protein
MKKCRSLFKPIVPLALIIATMLVAAGRLQAQPASPPATGPPRELRIASIGSLAPGISSEDVRLALEIIMQKTMLRKSDPFRIRLGLLPDFDNADALIAGNRYDFLTLTGFDFLALSRSMALTPLIILSKHDRPTETLLLVTQKDRSLQGLLKREKRVVVIDQNRTGEMSKRWLDTVLWEAGYPASDRFFTTIKQVNKTSQVLLPIFFGQADACVVTASAFALMAELNPQIETRLTVLERSPELVTMLLCATDQAEPEDREIILSEVKSVKGDPSLQQALTIVQMKRLIPFKQAYFQETETLFRHARDLAAKASEGSL